jgi:hypothetical protein
VGEKALELGVVEALLPIMNTAKVQPRWHMLGCLVSIAENGPFALCSAALLCYLAHTLDRSPVIAVTCAKELVAKGAARISEYCANPEELLITRHDTTHTTRHTRRDATRADGGERGDAGICRR